MGISMSLSAHYVTQSSVYSSPMLGPLTDRRIKKYQAQGFYEPVKKEERKRKRMSKRLTKEKVFAMFNI